MVPGRLSSHRQWVAPASVLALLLVGCGSPPLVEGWRAAEPDLAPRRCQAHRGTVMREAGELREGVPSALGSIDWSAERSWKSAVQGDGGWWISEVGGYSFVGGQRQGSLAWLADGADKPVRVAERSYAGVVVVEDGVLAVRGDCPKDARNVGASNITVLEHFEVTSDGVAPPTERARWVGFCPRYAAADQDGAVVVVGLVTIGWGPADTLEIVRVQGTSMRWQGSLPEDAWIGGRMLGAQMEVAGTGELIFSAGIAYPPGDPEAMPTQVVRRKDVGAVEMGVLVEGCHPARALASIPSAGPHRSLGIDLARDDAGVLVTLLPWGSIDGAVEYIRSLEGPVELALMDIPISPEQAQLLLRLPPGSRLTRHEGSLDEPSLSMLRERRPDLWAAP